MASVNGFYTLHDFQRGWVVVPFILHNRPSCHGCRRVFKLHLRHITKKLPILTNPRRLCLDSKLRFITEYAQEVIRELHEITREQTFSCLSGQGFPLIRDKTLVLTSSTERNNVYAFKHLYIIYFIGYNMKKYLLKNLCRRELAIYLPFLFRHPVMVQFRGKSKQALLLLPMFH